MKSRWLAVLSVSGVLMGCYDFGKTYEPCLDNSDPSECFGGVSTGSSTGVGGGATGGVSSGGNVASGGSSTGGDGIGGVSTGGAATGGAATGGASTGGASTGGVSTGGASTGGTGGTLPIIVARATMTEACPTKQAVEIYNPGPDPIPLASLGFSAKKTAFGYLASCEPTGEIAADGYVVFAANSSGSTGVVGACITGCDVSFSNDAVTAWFKIDGDDPIALGSFDDSKVFPPTGQCWIVTSSDSVSISSETLGEPN